MPIGKAIIERSVNNGPFVYIWYIDGAAQNASTSISTLSTAIDAIKPLAGALPGTINRVVLTVVSE